LRRVDEFGTTALVSEVRWGADGLILKNVEVFVTDMDRANRFYADADPDGNRIALVEG
jgi:hypothetical protein